jgi:hypothetical protein
VFGIGVTEMILIGLVILMLFSPRELPGMMKSLARVYGSIRRTACGAGEHLPVIDGTRIIQVDAFRLDPCALANRSLRSDCVGGGDGWGAGVPGEASRGHGEREKARGGRERGSR